jgi:hypothetical protein
MLKIDYRFVESINCCQDDHDYYMHAETIAIDFDFDYTNQLQGYENKRFNNDGKIAPKGFVGTGILSSPFLFFGNIFNNLLNNSDTDLLNYKILFYSFASLFYLFCTLFLIKKFLNETNLKEKYLNIFLWVFGSGLPYFAFERYSMTHVFEVFTITLVFYLSNKFYKNRENINFYAFLIPQLMVLALLVKWVNYYVLLIPIFLNLLLSKNYLNNKLLKNKYFYIGSFIGTGIFSYFSYVIYGKITFNPQFVYGTSGMLNGYIGGSINFLDFIISNLTNLFIILFTKEFGIFWFSPIIFIGLFVNIILIFFEKNKKPLFISLFMYAQTFGIVLMWQSTASSYGFRYLFNLIPLSIILFIFFKSKYKYKIIDYYILIFSVAGILSLFFFETTEMTQLSTVDQLNSFGRTLRFTEPEYLIGFLNSFFVLDSYLKIFTTSFLGAMFFKFIFIFIDKASLVSLLTGLGLPVDNQDFQDYLVQINDIQYLKFVFILLFIYIISKVLSKQFNVEN